MRLGSQLAVPLIGQSAAMGALPALRAATDPGAQGGELCGPRWQTRGHPVRATPLPKARDTEAARRLWAESEDKTRQLQPQAMTRHSEPAGHTGRERKNENSRHPWQPSPRRRPRQHRRRHRSHCPRRLCRRPPQLGSNAAGTADRLTSNDQASTSRDLESGGLRLVP